MPLSYKEGLKNLQVQRLTDELLKAFCDEQKEDKLNNFRENYKSFFNCSISQPFSSNEALILSFQASEPEVIVKHVKQIIGDHLRIILYLYEAACLANANSLKMEFNLNVEKLKLVVDNFRQIIYKGAIPHLKYRISNYNNQLSNQANANQTQIQQVRSQLLQVAEAYEICKKIFDNLPIPSALEFIKYREQLSPELMQDIMQFCNDQDIPVGNFERETEQPVSTSTLVAERSPSLQALQGSLIPQLSQPQTTVVESAPSSVSPIATATSSNHIANSSHVDSNELVSPTIQDVDDVLQMLNSSNHTLLELLNVPVVPITVFSGQTVSKVYLNESENTDKKFTSSFSWTLPSKPQPPQEPGSESALEKPSQTEPGPEPEPGTEKPVTEPEGPGPVIEPEEEPVTEPEVRDHPEERRVLESEPKFSPKTLSFDFMGSILFRSDKDITNEARQKLPEHFKILLEVACDPNLQDLPNYSNQQDILPIVYENFKVYADTVFKLVKDVHSSDDIISQKLAATKLKEYISSPEHSSHSSNQDQSFLLIRNAILKSLQSDSRTVNEVVSAILSMHIDLKKFDDFVTNHNKKQATDATGSQKEHNIDKYGVITAIAAQYDKEKTPVCLKSASTTDDIQGDIYKVEQNREFNGGPLQVELLVNQQQCNLDNGLPQAIQEAFQPNQGSPLGTSESAPAAPSNLEVKVTKPIHTTEPRDDLAELTQVEMIISAMINNMIDACSAYMQQFPGEPLPTINVNLGAMEKGISGMDLPLDYQAKAYALLIYGLEKVQNFCAEHNKLENPLDASSHLSAEGASKGAHESQVPQVQRGVSFDITVGEDKLTQGFLHAKIEKLSSESEELPAQHRETKELLQKLHAAVPDLLKKPNHKDNLETLSLEMTGSVSNVELPETVQQEVVSLLDKDHLAVERQNNGLTQSDNAHASTAHHSQGDQDSRTLDDENDGSHTAANSEGVVGSDGQKPKFVHRFKNFFSGK